MTTQIAIIDPFVKSPALNCFNGLVHLLKLPASYHMPSLFGIETLEKEKSQTTAYVVLGSASHVHENLSWHHSLANFLLDELKQNKPVLGCCFGHQLMCHALGADVEFFSPSEEKLSGTRKITVSHDFWNFKKGESFELGITHKQVVRNLPPDLLNVGQGIENDFVIHQGLPFLGTQAHPEASDHFCVADIQNLSSEDKERLQEDGKRFILRFFQHFNIC